KSHGTPPVQIQESFDHTAGSGNVSRKRTATTTPDRPVIAATNHIAPARPNAPAVRPANNAPSAYPRSRHRRYTPTDEARQIGAATSPIAASRVGYTIAVPIPSTTPPLANPSKLCDTITTP